MGVWGKPGGETAISGPTPPNLSRRSGRVPHPMVGAAHADGPEGGVIPAPAWKAAKHGKPPSAGTPTPAWCRGGAGRGRPSGNPTSVRGERRRRCGRGRGAWRGNRGAGCPAKREAESVLQGGVNPARARPDAAADGMSTSTESLITGELDQHFVAFKADSRLPAVLGGNPNGRE